MSETQCNTHSGTKPTTEIHWSDPVTITIAYEEALALQNAQASPKPFTSEGDIPST